MDLMQRRNMLMRGGKPYDAELEYLRSDGQAYIDTDVLIVDTPRVIIKVMMQAISDTDIFGFALNVVPSFIGDITIQNGNQQSFRYYRYYSTSGRGPALTSSVVLGVWATWDLGYIVKCNDVVLDTYNRESFANNTQTLYLFRGRNGNISNTNNYIAWAKIYDGDVLKRDYIPVRVGTTGYMYDKVSGQLFGNAGSGSFILGNDKI